MKTIDPKEKLTRFSEHWHPHQVGIVNDMQVLLAKVKGSFVWHQHEEEDELFQVLKGTLFVQFEDRTEEVKEGQILIVPRGVPHCPMTREGEEVHLMLFEKLGIKHTGEVEDARTQHVYPKI